MKNCVRTRSEKFFKMPFEQIISELHLRKEISLNELSKRSNITRQGLTGLAKKLGLRTRSIKESTQLTKNKGENHFMWGKTKETCARAKRSSDRMKLNNPNKIKLISMKRAKSLEKKQKLWPQEIAFRDILLKLCIKFETQKAIDIFNMDFFIPSINLCIEIDSTAKWGKERRLHAERRDKILLEKYSVKTLRIDKRKLKDLPLIINILDTNNIII